MGRGQPPDAAGPPRAAGEPHSQEARLGPADWVIGVGANLGPRLSTLRQAVGCIGELCSVLCVSNLYETKAVGPPQPDYLNAALMVRTSLSPLQLLAELMQIERRFGRVRAERWGARTLDLDLLWSDRGPIQLPELRVPHPRLCLRAFAILPLLDLVPLAADPSTGVAYAALAESLDGTGVRLVDDVGWAGR